MAGRRRVGSSVLRGPKAGRRSQRRYARDARGRFASTGASARRAGDDDDQDEPTRRRRRAAVAGVSATGAAVAASQVRKTSRTRTAIGRATIVRRHVGRARADHERNAARRARVLPGSKAAPFDAKAARREGRALTRGYRKQIRSVRSASKRSRKAVRKLGG